MLHPTPICLATLLTLAATVSAQPAITYLEGTSSTALALRTVAETAPGSPPQTVLTDLEVLPLEITGRTAQQALRSDVARREVRNGITRVELPGNGRLLRYRLGGGTRYGWLWIDAAGQPTVVLETAGVGAGGRTDPFTDRFAIAADGRHAAISEVAGGLWVVRLDGQDYASTGAPHRRIAVTGIVERLAVAAGPTHVFYVTGDDRIWRGALADGAAPQNVTPPAPAGVRLKDELVMSGDGTAVAFLLGPKDRYQIFLLRTAGSATVLPPPPAKYEEPGYLPEQIGGPRMLLNGDATRLLYTDATVRDEIFLLDTTGATAPTHVTSDANFVPYIGVGVFPSFAADTLALGVGDPDRLDWYTAQTGAPSVVNLTGTAAELQPPYGPGTLAPRAGYALPSGDTLLELVDASQRVQLRHVDPSGNSTTLASNLRGNLALGCAPGTAPAHVLVPDHGGDRLLDSGLNVLVSSFAGLLLSPDGLTPDGQSSVFLVSVAGGPTAMLLRLPNGVLFALPPMPGLRQAIATPRWGLVLNGDALQYFAPGGAAVISTNAAIRVVLS